MNYRVVYGETIPAWEKVFPTRRKAQAFAKKHKSFGDVIFSIAKVVAGEPPRSLTAAIDAGRVDEFAGALRNARMRRAGR
jgi:hypothetical protein